MAMRPGLLVLTMGCFIGASGAGRAEEPKQDLKPLLEEVRKLVQQQYPKATVTLKDQTIHFEFNTRKYMIHEPFLTGEWQDAFETVGPQKGGICGSLELRTGQWGGQAVLPQAFDKRYFVDWVRAPYSKKLNQHLLVSLMCPRDVPEEFREKFVRLVDEFEKHVGGNGK